MKTLLEKIAVMQAYADGKTIECSKNDEDEQDWHVVPHPVFNWSECDYRVAKEAREFWIVKSESDHQFVIDVCNSEFEAKAAASKFRHHKLTCEIIHVKEVI